ncbi:hypothetical protein SYJ56_07405 [Algoriphagus sp. D3-2-R+10]|nr:hypothetical protein [Algoriphagus sp. D3-2-R+10]MEB2775128.1 hypothetical protein [Algoriphagus sp. D3-2-R+10]
MEVIDKVLKTQGSNPAIDIHKKSSMKQATDRGMIISLARFPA